MAHRDDWIPTKQEDLHPWGNLFVDTCHDEVLDLLENPPLAEAAYNHMDSCRNDFNEIFAVANKSLKTLRTSQQVASLNLRMAAYRTSIRNFYNNFVRFSPLIEDDLKKELQAPIYDKTKTPAKTPDTAPVVVMSHCEHLLLKLDIRDLANPDKKVLVSKNVEFYGISAAVSAAVPNEDTFVFMNTFTKHIIEILLASTYKNKILYYRFRFTNGPDKKGPWSDTYNITIT